ncbi:MULTISPECIES: polysaccharide deacetylase family protein [unclassified Streptomyces]|uniref:polysaccharide deacetylase family protein n=1 Tax=unclassified Streptomyces TaxID=2593676 RepID=UPI00136B44EA|nr:MULTISPECIES: polysaccharide deacetylase family protein [unclassified Streptomyces]NEA00383.1 polysaccharide deacetylase family protein [Streptomyces sp. SID10116]MYY84509.1 polysaccharide deacetylase family protein [Streptomyces sp. SID335]MYZ14463.1 polysaccharide deacetylase family protein [Streptomyces sp. SID337]NDZ91615.1 polysaccharide deacetylase family protein [Streptomyces sp. SID10115]NEB46449.1 polysaccharide deacetylase family protein [Streptomyces sp. SID339]
MQLVRQKEECTRRRKNQARALVAALSVAAIASGCASGGGSAKPAHGQEPLNAPPARALDSYAQKLAATQVARTMAAKRWGLAKTPLPAPPPPAVKPRITTRKGFEVKGQTNLPPVFTTIPTKEKVVFLTIDDGAEKDPALLRMMSELRLPYTAFLSDYLVNEDYTYFKKMQDRGVTLNNHTLNHRYMPGLSYEGQRREICGMQDVIKKHYGKRPELFRPPYGNYNRDTLRAAKSCGIKAVPLWASEAFADHMEWREWDRDLHPGDIILTHFRGREDWKGTMPDMVRKVMKTVTDKGYAVARLEDYL